MKEHPILFSGEMVKAILDGRKTMTRRIAWEFDIHHKIRRSQPDAPIKWAGAVHPASESGWVSWYPGNGPLNGMPLDEFTKQQYAKGFECPYGKPGDRLWVRETWQVRDDSSYYTKVDTKCHRTTHPKRREIWEKEQPPSAHQTWKPSIFMPRWASRITLEITGVRVERLQEITEEDARVEGAPERPAHGQMVGDLGRQGHWRFRQGFRELWDKINGKRASWESNPWVWVVQFKKLPT